MKVQSYLIAIALLLFVSSCNKDSGGVTEVDPSDPDDVSRVLIIPGANSVDGQPPSPSSTPGTPTISNNQTSASVVSGNTLYLPFNFNSSNDGTGGYAGCYVQVDGASSYFDIPEDNPTSSDGLVVLPVGIPDNITEGEFCLSYCIYDADNRVSNVLSTCITIGSLQECPAFNSGSSGLTIASYDLGDEAGIVEIEYDTYFIPDRIDVFYDNEWVGGSGSAISISDIPPVSQCNDGVDGYVGERGEITFNYDPEVSRTVTIYMSGCLGNSTAWDLAVSCPTQNKIDPTKTKILTSRIDPENLNN